MQLSQNAITDLRLALNNSYGINFADDFSDAEINDVGNLILNGLVEGLKFNIAKQTTTLQ